MLLILEINIEKKNITVGVGRYDRWIVHVGVMN